MILYQVLRDSSKTDRRTHTDPQTASKPCLPGSRQDSYLHNAWRSFHYSCARVLGAEISSASTASPTLAASLTSQIGDAREQFKSRYD